MEDLIETMSSALRRFSTGRVVQPVRPTVEIADDSFFATMPAYVRADAPARGSDLGQTGVRPGSDPGLTLNDDSSDSAALGAKLVTVFGRNALRNLHSHLASILLLDPETGALQALLDGRYITEARTAAVSAVSSRLLARKTAASLAIIGTGVQARSHLDALSLVHRLRQVTVWSPNKSHRDAFVDDAKTAISGSDPGLTLKAVDHAGEAVVGADIIVLVTSSPTPVLENGWVKPGAHVISVGACRPNQREMDRHAGGTIRRRSHRRRARRAAGRRLAGETPQRHRSHDLQEPGAGCRGCDGGGTRVPARRRAKRRTGIDALSRERPTGWPS
jgi:ornithine cyclodeaminase